MNESLALAKNIIDINYDDIPSNVIDITKRSFLDTLGVMLAAGTLGEGCKQCVSLVLAAGGKKESTIIGFDAKVPAYMAAFANGSMSHALDFEDVHDAALVHPNAATIPAALAVAESVGSVSGKEFITAITLGSDMVSRLGLALTENPVEYGWYMTPILGAFGATTAACKLLDLGVGQILDAFSLTLCQATCSAELIYSPHSVVRAIRDAFSTKAGVLSTLLAKKGVTGFDQPIEGKAGLFTMYSRGNYDRLILTKGLGKIFEGANVSFKPWPSCRGTHPYIDATLQIVGMNNIKASDVREIRLVVNPVTKVLCEPLKTKRHPVTAIDAKFSLPFVIATALLHRKVTLHNFTPQALKDQDVLEVARKVTCELDAKLSLREATQGFVEIKTECGEVYTKRVDFAYGHPNNPIDQETLVAKFMDCATHSVKKIPKKSLNKVAELILNLEEVKNISGITEWL